MAKYKSAIRTTVRTNCKGAYEYVKVPKYLFKIGRFGFIRTGWRRKRVYRIVPKIVDNILNENLKARLKLATSFTFD